METVTLCSVKDFIFQTEFVANAMHFTSSSSQSASSGVQEWRLTFAKR